MKNILHTNSLEVQYAAGIIGSGKARNEGWSRDS